MSAAVRPGPLDAVGRFRTHGVVPTFSRASGAVTHDGPTPEPDVAVRSSLGRVAEAVAAPEREGVV